VGRFIQPRKPLRTRSELAIRQRIPREIGTGDERKNCSGTPLEFWEGDSILKLCMVFFKQLSAVKILDGLFSIVAGGFVLGSVLFNLLG
jgi:hypothetical protein